MKTSPVSLTGTTLRFDRSGRRLITIEREQIAVLDVATAHTHRLPYAGARAVAGFDDQLWIATHDHHLVRLDAGGTPLGEPTALPFAARAVLSPAPCGAPAAVWAASPPIALADDAGALACTELPGVDAVIPITGRRFVRARGASLVLPSGLTVPLAPNTAVLGGCVGSDGKSATVLVAHSGGRQLVVVSLGLGQVKQRRSIPSREPIAIAHHIAVIQLEPRVLWIVELANNRELGRLTLDHNVAAFALDPTGRSLATRDDMGGIALHRLEQLVQRPIAAVPSAAVAASAASAAVAASAAIDREVATEPADRPTPRPPFTGDPAGAGLPAVAPAPGAAADSSTRAARDFEQLLFQLDATTATRMDAPVAPAVRRGAAREAAAIDEPAIACSFSAPTVHATDWLCGSGDYLGGGS